MSQQQPINILKMLKNFFACKIVVAANQRYPGNIQRSFRLQICLSRKTSKSWKNSETFSPPKSSSPQIIDILEIFKDFFGCKIVVAANQRYPGNIQRLFRLQICLSRKSSISWKYSKTFSAAKLSQPQIRDILETFKDFFDCKFVSAANHLYPGNIQKLFACKVVLAANYRYPGNIQRLFRLQNYLSSFHQNSENIEGLYRLQICLSRKSTISWNYSKTFSAAKLSQQQTIKNLKIFKDSFACKIVLAANHLYPGNIQRLFRLQNCLSRKSSISWKSSKTFSTANLSQPQIIYILEIFKNFSPAKLSQPQIIDIPEIFKDFFGCKIVLVAIHQNSGNIEGLFGLQICLSRKSSISW